MRYQVSFGPVLGILPRFALLTTLFGASVAMAQESQQNCRPQSHVAPGRLNVELGAEGYGFKSSCSANLQMYIPKNSELRSVDSAIRISAKDGGILNESERKIELARTNYGMFASNVSFEAASEERCRHLTVELVIRRCFNGEGIATDCPDIRVKAADAFHDFGVTGAGVNVCRD